MGYSHQIMPQRKSTVSSWETGRTVPDLDTLHRIAQVLEVTVEELIYSQRLKEPTIIQQVVERKEVKNSLEAGSVIGTALAVVIS